MRKAILLVFANKQVRIERPSLMVVMPPYLNHFHHHLHHHLTHDQHRSVTVIESFNVQDLEGAMSPSEISTSLGLSALKNRTWAIFKTSAIKGEGLEEAMEW